MSTLRYFACLSFALAAGWFVDRHMFGPALYTALTCLVYAIDALVDATKESKRA